MVCPTRWGKILKLVLGPRSRSCPDPLLGVTKFLKCSIGRGHLCPNILHHSDISITQDGGMVCSTRWGKILKLALGPRSRSCPDPLLGVPKFLKCSIGRGHLWPKILHHSDIFITQDGGMVCLTRWGKMIKMGKYIMVTMATGTFFYLRLSLVLSLWGLATSRQGEPLLTYLTLNPHVTPAWDCPKIGFA